MKTVSKRWTVANQVSTFLSLVNKELQCTSKNYCIYNKYLLSLKRYRFKGGILEKSIHFYEKFIG